LFLIPGFKNGLGNITRVKTRANCTAFNNDEQTRGIELLRLEFVESVVPYDRLQNAIICTKLAAVVFALESTSARLLAQLSQDKG